MPVLGGGGGPRDIIAVHHYDKKIADKQRQRRANWPPITLPDNGGQSRSSKKPKHSAALWKQAQAQRCQQGNDTAGFILANDFILFFLDDHLQHLWLVIFWFTPVQINARTRPLDGFMANFTRVFTFYFVVASAQKVLALVLL